VNTKVVAHQENGNAMANLSEWLGAASTAALADVYHPNNRQGIAPASESVGFGNRFSSEKRNTKGQCQRLPN
jgi:hypothetical protein